MVNKVKEHPLYGELTNNIITLYYNALPSKPQRVHQSVHHNEQSIFKMRTVILHN